MKIPVYVQELMGRAAFDRLYTNLKSEPGYTIKIKKATPYTYASTLRAECERLVAWANRQPCGPDTAAILECPADTHYCRQVAYVTIYDPIMQKLEPLIADNF